MQIDYFHRTVEDLTQTIQSLMPGAARLVYIHHPYLEHLTAHGAGFSSMVAETVAAVALRHEAKFYDATEDLRQEFGRHPENFYIPNDLHLNEHGLQAYGVAVAKFLAGNVIQRQP